MTSRTVPAAAVSSEIRIGEVDANLQALAAALDRGLRAGASLVVLPELATSGYVFADRAEAVTTALTADDERLARVARMVPPTAVAVLGFCERAGDELYNSALALSGGEVLAVYRKSHLWGAEKRIFADGHEAGAVVDSPLGRLGIAICYDNEFPEVPRRLALAGADLLALPVNWPLVERPEGERAPETIQAMAAARSSRMATVIADRHGTERGVPWTGGTAIVSSDGWIVAEPDDSHLAYAELALAGHTALGEFNDLFGDRRPELYHPVPPSID